MSGPRRVRLPHVERLFGALSPRDWAIVSTLYRLHLASGLQLERLHFQELANRSKSVKRWQVLERLVNDRVLMPFERRVGGAASGSDKLCYTLDSAGQRLMRFRTNAEAPDIRVRRPRTPGDRFVAHTLAVSELYVALVELSRLAGFTVEQFDVEPRWPDGLGGWLRPDAYVQLAYNGEQYSWWYEADMATESLPTVGTKLRSYLDFVQRGQLGPGGVMPWVLTGVPTQARLTAIQKEINKLEEPASYLFRVAEFSDLTHVMTQEFVR